MGCDIHLHVEKKVDGQWNRWERTEVVTWPSGYRTAENYYGYSGRNYDLFGMLADVRNGRGFAGCDTGDGFKPISMPKGFPEDASYEVEKDKDCWEGDGHSHSYLTLSELLAYDWEQKTKSRGIISEEQYQKFDREKGPETYSGGISGPGIRVVSESDYLALKANGDLSPDVRWHIQVEWGVTYKNEAGSFYTKTLPRLKELAEGDPESVRIVFWFDN
jgi:hypothetical protein